MVKNIFYFMFFLLNRLCGVSEWLSGSAVEFLDSDMGLTSLIYNDVTVIHVYLISLVRVKLAPSSANFF